LTTSSLVTFLQSGQAGVGGGQCSPGTTAIHQNSTFYRTLPPMNATLSSIKETKSWNVKCLCRNHTYWSPLIRFGKAHEQRSSHQLNNKPPAVMILRTCLVLGHYLLSWTSPPATRHVFPCCLWSVKHDLPTTDQSSLPRNISSKVFG
jgi:hypothetical protein